MNAIDQAEELRQQAIKLLLDEQERVGERLLQLGYDQENAPAGKRRGRRSKVTTESDAPANDTPPLEKADEVSVASGSLTRTVQDRK